MQETLTTIKTNSEKREEQRIKDEANGNACLIICLGVLGIAVIGFCMLCIIFK